MDVSILLKVDVHLEKIKSIYHIKDIDALATNQSPLEIIYGVLYCLVSSCDLDCIQSPVSYFW